MTQLLTMSMQNLFKFTCPVMDTEVEMRGCVLLRERVYMGKKLETRRGCQACVSGGLCPVAKLISRNAFNPQQATDECSSTEPKSGKLPAFALEAIERTVVTESTLSIYRPNDHEREKIATAQERIAKALASAPRNTRTPPKMQPSSTPPKRRAVGPVPDMPKQAAAQPVNSIADAAKSGDLAAAISQ